MAEHFKINPHNELLLDQSLLRLPAELLRSNFRSARRMLEVEKEGLFRALRDLTNKARSGDMTPADIARRMEAIVARGTTIETRLTASRAREQELLASMEARLGHVGVLRRAAAASDSQAGSTTAAAMLANPENFDYLDVAYDEWDRTRFDRMLVEYLLRHGHVRTARAVAHDRGISALVDIGVYDELYAILDSLRSHHRLDEAMAWCAEHKKALRQLGPGVGGDLELELRFQQFVELVRAKRISNALDYVRTHILPHHERAPDMVRRAAGLVAFGLSGSVAPRPHESQFDDARWNELADHFEKAFNTLLKVPPVPLLHVALSLGMSTLRTPACVALVPPTTSSHAEDLAESSKKTAPPPDHKMSKEKARLAGGASNETSNQQLKPPVSWKIGIGDGVSGHAMHMVVTAERYPYGRMCPACSPEMIQMARVLPYAHHSRSRTDPDLRGLPNGRVYGLQRLRDFAEDLGVEGVVDICHMTQSNKGLDLENGSIMFSESALKPVYIT